MEDCHCTKRLDSWKDNRGRKDTHNLLCMVQPFSPPSGPGFQTPNLLPHVQDSSLFPQDLRLHPSLRLKGPVLFFHFSDSGIQYSISPSLRARIPGPSPPFRPRYLRVERVVIICVIVVITEV